MDCCLSQLRNKIVINCRTGCRIGYVDDLEINTRDARVCAIVIFGRLKCFGLLGRKDDCVIPWKMIELIGEDAILVKCEGEFRRRRRKKGIGFGKF